MFAKEHTSDAAQENSLLLIPMHWIRQYIQDPSYTSEEIDESFNAGFWKINGQLYAGKRDKKPRLQQAISTLLTNLEFSFPQDCLHALTNDILIAINRYNSEHALQNCMKALFLNETSVDVDVNPEFQEPIVVSGMFRHDWHESNLNNFNGAMNTYRCIV